MKYLVHHGSGEEVVESKVSDFLRQLPYFISTKNKLIPPAPVIRQLLEVGRYDVGMSGLFTWEPFNIEISALEEVNRDLIAHGYVKPEVPGWVVDDDTWDAWKLETLKGVPSDRYLELLNNVKTIKSDIAKLSHLEGEAKSLSETKLLEAEFELSDFLNNYLS